MQRARIAVAVAFAITLSLFAACSIYSPSLLGPAPADASTSDASAIEASTIDGSVASDADSCQHVSVPEKPASDDPSDASVDFTVAVSYFRLVVGGTATVNHPAAPTGLDLDHDCTCPGPPSCVSPTQKVGCDLDGGADDNAGQLFASYAIIAPGQFSDDGLNDGLRQGANGLLYRVRNYNGAANDTQVTVIAYLAAGINGIQDGGPFAPKYDGTDVWAIAPSALLGGDTLDGGPTCEGNDDICVPVFFDANAYVANGVLVAHIDHPFDVGAIVSRIQVTLSNSVISAPLLFDGVSYRIDEGRISGRWGLGAFLASLQSLSDPFSMAGGVCGDSGTYQNIKMSACASGDIMTNPEQDNMGAACDAFSIQVAFSANAAHLGPIATPKSLRTPCGATWQDNCSQ